MAVHIVVERAKQGTEGRWGPHQEGAAIEATQVEKSVLRLSVGSEIVTFLLLPHFGMVIR